MRNKLITLLEYCHGVLIIIALLPVVQAWGFQGNMPMLYHMFLVLIPFIVSRLAEEHISHLIPFLLVCALGCLPVLLLPEEEHLPFLLISTALILSSLGSRLGKTDDIFLTPGPMTLLIFVLIFFFGTALKMTVPQSFATYCTIGYLLVYALYLHLDNVDNFLQMNKEVSNLPQKQISKTNTILIVVFMVVLVTVFIVITNIGLDHFFDKLGEALSYIIKMLLQNSGDVEETMTTAAEAVTNQNAGNMYLPTDPTPEWVSIMWSVLTGIITVLVIGGLIAAAVYGIISLFRRFYKAPNDNNDTLEFISAKQENDIISYSEKEKTANLRFSFEPDSVIRKQYIKAVKSRKKKIQSCSMTPQELENYVGLKPEGDENIIHTLYEKARYSNAGCSSEEAELYRREIKRH